MSFHYQKDLHMKYFTGAFAGVLMVAGLAFSTPTLAAQTCAGCKADFDRCIAAGGNLESCWTCNNPTCSPFSSRDTLGSTLDRLSTNKSKAFNPAEKRPVAALLDS